MTKRNRQYSKRRPMPETDTDKLARRAKRRQQEDDVVRLNAPELYY